MTITTRSGKGSALTTAELDGNWSDLDGRVASNATAVTTEATARAAADAAITKTSIGLSNVDNTSDANKPVSTAQAAAIAAAGGGTATTGLNAINLLSTGLIKTLALADPYFVAFPTAGNTAQIASRPSGESGTVQSIQMSVDGGAGSFDARLRVYWDQAVVPDIDVDLGTLFASHGGAHTGVGQHAKTRSVAMSTMGTNTLVGGGGSTNWASYELKFDMPYGNGFKAEIYTPFGITVPGSGTSLFSLVKYRTDSTSPMRLRSRCQSRVDGNALAAYAASADVPFFDVPNCAGWLVYLAFHVFGASNYTYLERPTFFYRDGETTPGHFFTGGEEWGATGWYFCGASRLCDDQIMLTDCHDSSTYATSYGVDLLAYHGGVRFTNELSAKWTNKTGYAATTAHKMGWTFLFYVDSSVTYAPTAPLSVTSTPANTGGTVNWLEPLSQGSAFISGYTVTLSPGGATQTVTANVRTAVFTGLTNGTAYTPTVRANSTAGNSSNATGAAFTPAAVANTLSLSPSTASIASGSPVTFTLGMASGAFSGVATPASNGPGTFSPTSLSAPGTFIFTPSGGATTDSISITNTGGMTNPSSSTLTVTAAGALISDDFNRTNATTLGTTPVGSAAWSVAAASGTPTAGIDTNRAYLTGTQDFTTIATVSAASAVHTVTGTIAALGSVAGYAGLVARFVDTNNYILLQIETGTSGATAYGLYKKVAGSYTNIGTTTGITPAAGDVLQIIVAAANAVSFKVNGTAFAGATVADAALASAVKVGMQANFNTGASGASTVRFDNFSVT